MGMAYSTEDLIARQKAKIREQKQYKYDTAVQCLKDMKKVMGPAIPPCCDGCEFEWSEALEMLNRTLKEIGEEHD